MIEHLVFVSEEKEIFDAMNERLRQLVEENGEELCQADNRDNILYETECLETQGISISFYRNGNYRYQSYAGTCSLLQSDAKRRGRG
ncbi:MAG: hypothetical protein K2J95_04225 [Lachnospiraceae bacterium]|nr:hypothetical protein [Lachnospiraceae bacterium]